jgi:hypothetical protein
VVQTLIVLAGAVGLTLAVIAIWYAVSLLVLRAVSALLPLTGRRKRTKGQR